VDLHTRSLLLEVFGDPTNVVPAGTGAILTRPSKLDNEFASKVVDGLELDAVFRDLGAITAREIADDMEQRGLKPADFAALEGLPEKVSKRIAENLGRSEVFKRALCDHLKLRG
jgi:hypothetical protein